jgi:uncharacterized protein YndB with AHSA1/START domain
MASVTESMPMTAPVATVWAVLSNPSRFGEWVDIHTGFVGEPPTDFTVGSSFGQKLRVMGMPVDVTWTVEEVVPQQRIVLSGDGPMGVGLTATYSVEPIDAGSLASATFDFSGAAVMMVGSQLTRETAQSLRVSLQTLRGIVEA